MKITSDHGNDAQDHDYHEDDDDGIVSCYEDSTTSSRSDDDDDGIEEILDGVLQSKSLSLDRLAAGHLLLQDNSALSCLSMTSTSKKGTINTAGQQQQQQEPKDVVDRRSFMRRENSSLSGLSIASTNYMNMYDMESDDYGESFTWSTEEWALQLYVLSHTLIKFYLLLTHLPQSFVWEMNVQTLMLTRHRDP